MWSRSPRQLTIIAVSVVKRETILQRACQDLCFVTLAFIDMSINIESARLQEYRARRAPFVESIKTPIPS